MAQKSKAYVDDLLDMSDPPETNNCQSEVSQYYKGRNVLITGASGFFGILLIERLLRCCPGIGKIYITMKSKKGKSVEDRFKEHFDDVIYDRLKKEQPDYITKVIMIEADFGEVNLGLSPENRKRLLDTNIIFHMAAIVRFNETIRNVINVNVRGTKEILLFMKEMPNLEAFVYTSTAYSHCVYMSIDEKYYPPPFETDKILMLLDVLDDEKLDQITPILIGKWPNTYVFSKAIAEDTVRQYGVELPVCIVRPSIVISTAKEPVSGWVNNIYGAVGVVMGSALGLLHTLYCVPEYKADLMPADYVIANIIVAGWDIAKRKDILLSIDNANPDIPENERKPIYNCVSSSQNPITWKKFMKINEKYGMRLASTKVFWYYMLFLEKYRFVYNIYKIFLHIIPAIIVDALAYLTGRKPMLLKVYKKIHIFSEVIAFFSTRQWEFQNNAVIKLWDRLNPVDREIFNFNMRDVDWEEHLKNIIYGIRIYIFKETREISEEAIVKYRRLKIAHYTLLTIFWILIMWVIVSLINFLLLFFL
ncbi:PREDICTED: fatty acyl-CoA reductase 1-like [Dinoponera quadriceps]|uniref:Fatty acyl-CoA reductase n=1 Tax=Dinoponera quadriceps TaxID=609295 RepID=A0A6P3XM83_DINQU|nr:PREDICTED: fatty acyl-CoA reductase 1-like [Dinoponera quadriceps]XP_014479567.1 PREDICTED: fatty acyl-CoA reductase 1-like [Dinoponera quadriceps]XP_014479568.1 PREDICTED: fatty acyl-CoA reductase 1-like [Dinoponera quadriceps]